jgi:hypothetical protein
VVFSAAHSGNYRMKETGYVSTSTLLPKIYLGMNKMTSVNSFRSGTQTTFGMRGIIMGDDVSCMQKMLRAER